MNLRCRKHGRLGNVVRFAVVLVQLLGSNTNNSFFYAPKIYFISRRRICARPFQNRPESQRPTSLFIYPPQKGFGSRIGHLIISFLSAKKMNWFFEKTASCIINYLLHCAQRFAATRSWRFLPQMFIRRTKVC